MPRLTEYEQRREVEDVVVHPRYNSGTNKLSVLMKILCHLSPPTNQNHQHHQFNRNDIALLKVKSDFNCIERRLYPACLPTRYRNCTDIKTEAKQTNWNWNLMQASNQQRPQLVYLKEPTYRGEDYSGWKRVTLLPPSLPFQLHFLCLFLFIQNPDDLKGLVTGWGRTSENGGPLSTTLLKVGSSFTFWSFWSWELDNSLILHSCTLGCRFRAIKTAKRLTMEP